jgi:hypothetical protein
MSENCRSPAALGMTNLERLSTALTYLQHDLAVILTLLH